MEWYIKWFIRASLVWFTLGIFLGIAIAAHPLWVIYRPAHAHMNVVGFITMMIFGVGYQLLPRLFGHPLKSQALAVTHWWFANGGLALMVVGWFMAPNVPGSASAMVTTTGGVLFTLGALTFVINMWRTFDAADARVKASKAAGSGGKQLPTLGE